MITETEKTLVRKIAKAVVICSFLIGQLWCGSTRPGMMPSPLPYLSITVLLGVISALVFKKGRLSSCILVVISLIAGLYWSSQFYDWPPTEISAEEFRQRMRVEKSGSKRLPATTPMDVRKCYHYDFGWLDSLDDRYRFEASPDTIRSLTQHLALEELRLKSDKTLRDVVRESFFSQPPYWWRPDQLETVSAFYWPKTDYPSPRAILVYNEISQIGYLWLCCHPSEIQRWKAEHLNETPRSLNPH